MKISVVGKGGTGKTLVSATLARLLAQKGRKVVAVDLDSNPNLGFALGLDYETMEAITPIVDNEELVTARTALPGMGPGAFKLNPKVSDLVESFGVPTRDDVLLLVAGFIVESEQGCMCGAHALLKALLRHLVKKREEFVVLDVEAGLEVFGRGTVKHTDFLVVVTDPSVRSLQTVDRIVKLAEQEGIPPEKIICVVNKLPKEGPSYKREIIEKHPFLLVLEIPMLEDVAMADLTGSPVIDQAPDSIFVAKIESLASSLAQA
ncbi:MAG: ATP-binding protein [Candidatus Hodarchaeales archaeon]|jgi:CO dehydrogenase maturation factor